MVMEDMKAPVEKAIQACLPNIGNIYAIDTHKYILFINIMDLKIGNFTYPYDVYGVSIDSSSRQNTFINFYSIHQMF